MKTAIKVVCCFCFNNYTLIVKILRDCNAIIIIHQLGPIRVAVAMPWKEQYTFLHASDKWNIFNATILRTFCILFLNKVQNWRCKMYLAA